MKKLKFDPKLCGEILIGSKTSTWRLFDDKDLMIGDEVDFVNRETLESIGKGIITGIKLKTFSTLTEADWIGHERYNSEADMYKTYRGYYGKQVSPDSTVKIIHFTFTPNKADEA